MLFIAWLYGEQNQMRPQFPMETGREDLVAASRLFDLAPQMPPVDWDKMLWTLPMEDILKAAEGPKGIFADKMPVPTGGAMVRRTPERSGLDQGRAVARQHAAERARPVVHVLVRRLGGPEPRDVQPRAQDRQARGREAAVGDHRPGRALLVHPRHRGHRGRRAQHGRRAAGLRRDRLRLLRQVPEGRRQDAARYAAEGHLLHDGPQQVADLRDLAARRRASR